MSNLGGKSIPLYDSAPLGKIQSEELEELIYLRDRLLHEIEARNQFEKDKNEKQNLAVKYNTSLNAVENKIGWESYQENDKISHFILSLAYCKTDQDRIWFASMESKLFLARVAKHYNSDFEEVLRMLDIPLERQDNLPERLLEKIRFNRDNKTNMQNETTFRIPFEYAFNLIPTMQYFLHKGFVYITNAELAQLVETVFRENLIKKLLNVNRYLDKLLSDTRIRMLINNFTTRREVETLSKNFSSVQSNMNINFKEVDTFAEKAFPLCMQLLNKNLTQEGKLKHWGRLQYGLFLKGIGLSLEESLTFWKNKFAKTTPADKFEKEYSYNIRHSYGKEGKRNDYIPYSCNKIQVTIPNPNTGEHHGCPFKVYSEEKMRNILYQMNMKELDVLKILEKVRNKEPSIACMRYFESKYPGQPYQSVGIHPNYYFESAIKLFKTEERTNRYTANNYNKANPIAFENNNNI